MDAMPSDENQPFLRMEDFQKFPGYGMPQQPMPWESYGIMMDPFSSPVVSVPVLVQEKRPSSGSTAVDKNQAQSVPLGPDTVRSKLRESLTEALKMVAGEHPREKIVSFLDGGDAMREVEAAETAVDEPVPGGSGALPHAKRSKLPFSFSSPASPCKKMRMDCEDSFGILEERVTEHAKLVSKNIEIELLRIFRAVNKKYKEKARSLMFNLKDKNNPELRARVFVGEVSPEQLCSMTTEELASKELSQWRMAKAEERAQKVVITDEDVNPSKIVKKTHKGEIIMEVDSEAPVAPVKEVQGVTSANEDDQDAQEESQAEGDDDGEAKDDEQEVGDEKVYSDTKEEAEAEVVEANPVNAATDVTTTVSANEAMEAAPSSDTVATAEEMAVDAGDAAAADKVGTENAEDSTEPLLDVSDFKGLPEIMSMDGYLKSLGCTTGEDLKNADIVDEKKAEEEDTEMRDACKADEKASDGTTTRNNPLKRKLGDSGERKQHDSPSTKVSPRKNSEDTAGVVAPPQNLQLWEGSLQLTGTRSTAVHGVFRSGRHEVKLDSWPKQLEVKGRVKLGPLAKFLKDLCNSKSRAVTVMSFFSSDMATSSLSLLKEVADQYEKAERVGYVEPGTGYELYLFPPGKATWKFLTENGRLKPSADLPKDKSEVLVGCVVWRKSKSSSDTKKSSSSSADKSKRGSSSSSAKAPSSKHSREKHPPSSSSACPPAATVAAAATAVSPVSTSKPLSPQVKSVVSQQQTQSVVTHSVNEWQQQQQQQQQSSLCSPSEPGLFPSSLLPPPPPLPPFLSGLPASSPLEGLPPGFHHPTTFVHLSQALGALLPGAKLPGFEGPPGFWQQQQQQQHQQPKDGNDLPEFDYEGHVPMSVSTGMNIGGAGYGLGGFQAGFQHHLHHPHLDNSRPYGHPAVSEGMGINWQRTGGGSGGQVQLEVLGKQQQQQQLDGASNLGGGGGGFPVLRPPLPPGPPPPPGSAGGATTTANSSYGQWIHPNQAAQQKSLHYKKASVAPSQQRRHRG